MEKLWALMEQGQVLSTVLRLLLAALCGGLIGLERGKQNRPAGLKTHMLVCMASALVMLTGRYLIQEFGVGDPARLGAQVISGIGFLGAGTILVDRQKQIRGLTTAAGLWASACVGLALGIGFYLGAVVATILVLIIFVKFSEVERRFIGKSELIDLHAAFSHAEDLNAFLALATGRGYHTIAFEVVPSQGAPGEEVLSANMTLTIPLHTDHTAVIAALSAAPGLCTLELLGDDMRRAVR